MSVQQLSDAGYRRDLGGGLVLRWSTTADFEGLREMYADAFRRDKDTPPNPIGGLWIRDMMSGRHPLIDAGDWALVEDTDRGKIVSATCLMNQVWEYEGIAFPVGRPEIVATDADYRERGLVRAIFELIHARSAAREHMAQGITGIAYYYRQFGYEYALDLEGHRYVTFDAIPKLKEGEPEPYTLRDATTGDLPQIMALHDRERARGPVSAVLDEAYWRWLLEGQNPEGAEGWRVMMIADAAKSAVGYLLRSRRRWGEAVRVAALWVDEGVPLVGVLPSVMRALRVQAETMPTMLRPNTPPPSKIAFGLEGAHPVYDALGALASVDPPYGWYVRVPDLPRFIRQIAPALERRLAGSIAAGYTGDLRIDFYRGGLRLAFDRGRIAAAEHWNARAERWGPKAQAGFPPLVFLQLLFGRRSLAELRHAFPDAWADGDAPRALLEGMFPARPSWVLPLD
jgi:hypothetical protein